MVEKYIVLAWIAWLLVQAIRHGVDRSKAACGLFGGFSTSLSKTEMDCIVTLGFLSSLRGVDSTGIVMGYKGKKNTRMYSIVKDTVCAPEFLTSERTEKALEADGRFLVIGHARAATVGAVELDNAHPFKFGSVMGVHNGTIQALANKGHTSDSRALYSIIAEKGIQEAVDAAGYGAAYALVWVDIQNRSLNVLRNSQRTLWYCTSGGGRTIYWASEKNMLIFAAARSNITITEPVAFSEDMHYVLPTDGSTFDFKTTEVKKTQPVVAQATRKHGQSTNSSTTMRYTGGVWYTKNSDGVWVAEEQHGTKSDTKMSGDKYRVGKFIKPIEQVAPLIEKGCFICGSVPSLYLQSTHWLTHTDFVCSPCKVRNPGRLLSGYFKNVPLEIGYKTTKEVTQ